MEGGIIINLKILKDRNFSLLLTGRVASLLASNLLSFSLALFVLNTTGSSVRFASVLAMSGLATILVMPVSSVFADWFDRKRIMVFADIMGGAAVGAVFLLFLAGFDSILIIYALVVFMAILDAIDSPAVETAVPSIVKSEDLADANSLNTFSQTICRIVAPLAGGALCTYFEITPILFIVMILYFITASVEAFLVIPSVRKPLAGDWMRVFAADFKEGVAFIGKSRQIMGTAVVCIFTNFILGAVLTIGIPVIVKITLQSSDMGYSASQTILVIGTLLGSVIAPAIMKKMKTSSILAYSIIVGGTVTLLISVPVFPAFLGGFGWSASFTAICALIFFSGIIVSVVNISIITMVQSKTPNELLGRVMGVLMTIAMSFTPLGRAIFGVVFDRLDAWLIFLLSGAATVVVGCFSLLFVREEKGQTIGCPAPAIPVENSRAPVGRAPYDTKTE